MNTGVFTHIAHSYFKAAGNSWLYLRRVAWALKPIILPLVLVYSLILLAIGLIFSLGIVLDWLGKLTDACRRLILGMMKNQSDYIDDGLFSFLFRPIFLVALSPLLIVFLLVPKLSSDSMDSFITNESSGTLDGSGAFKMVNGIFFHAVRRLYNYVADTAYLLLKPITAAVAIVYSLVLLALGFCFALLIPLDWLSHFVEFIRQSTARAAYRLQQCVPRSFIEFVFVPPLLIVLAPLFLVLLIIPKITSQMVV
ncbi:MAG: hypothetical protein PHU14_09645 [Methylovulum sp.]|nr:hypothetical protein [Methylovulum sp.]